MDVTYINPFIASTISTFKTMLNTDVKPGKISLKKGDFPLFDVSGVIGLSGEATGAISISFPKLVALKVVSTMLGISIKIIGPDVTDGIGEIANIIAGNAKQDLTQFKINISLPNVIIGQNHYISKPSDAPGIIVPFDSSLGNFAMEITLKTKTI
ncbi:MAG: chemotaxis protein CheX [Chitinispirillia bacterium]|jgi:chemotaxis protein CheX